MFGGHVFAIVHYTFFFYLKSVELIRVLCNIMISPLPHPPPPPPPHTHTHPAAISDESQKSAKEIM